MQANEKRMKSEQLSRFTDSYCILFWKIYVSVPYAIYLQFYLWKTIIKI